MRGVRPRAALLLSLPVLAGGSCATEHKPNPTPQILLGTLTNGAMSISVDHTAHFFLSRGGTRLLTIDPEGLALGTVDAVDDGFNYDPFRLVVPNALWVPPDSLKWEEPTSAELALSEDAHLVIRLAYPDRTALLDIRAKTDDRFDFTLVPGRDDSVAFMRIGALADKTEGFYGLGESYDDVNQRGHVRAMQLELDSSLESGDNEAHVPIPLLLGTRGWGLFVDDPHPGVFEVANTSDDRIAATFGTGVDSKKGLSFYVFTDDKPIDLTRHYYDLTGYPTLPADWSLGPLVWRNKDQATATTDLDQMRNLDLPTTAIWLDDPYATGTNTFDFDATRFPSPDALIAHAHDLGFRMGLWHTPYLSQKDPATAPLRAEANALGVYPKAFGLPLNPWGTAIDFTNPTAVTFWQHLLTRYTSHGIEGFKLDYGEDVVAGLTGGRIPWEFADGSDERTMHERYQIFYHRTYGDLLPKGGGFLLCRHAAVGDQANGLIIWPGDLDASFSKQRDVVTASDGSSYTAVGGLPASIVAGLTLGPSGFPLYGADTGGYRHDAPDKELFTRWFEQTALSSVMQLGNGARAVAWEPDPKTGFDSEMLGWYQRYTRLHLRLYAYEWSLLQNLVKDGRPIERPLGLVDPELGVHPNDEYMFGDDLLVAPIVERGATSRSVVFPDGRWIDFWTGEIIPGGQTIDRNAPLDTLPLFLRDGAIVPLLRPSIETLSPTTQPTLVDSFATTPGVLYARLVPSDPSTFTVFDGTVLSSASADVVTISIAPGSLFHFGAVFRVDGLAAPPSSVKVDGVPLVKVMPSGVDAALEGFAIEPNGAVVVHVTPGPHTITLTP